VHGRWLGSSAKRRRRSRRRRAGSHSGDEVDLRKGHAFGTATERWPSAAEARSTSIQIGSGLRPVSPCRGRVVVSADPPRGPIAREPTNHASSWSSSFRSSRRRGKVGPRLSFRCRSRRLPEACRARGRRSPGSARAAAAKLEATGCGHRRVDRPNPVGSASIRRPDRGVGPHHSRRVAPPAPGAGEPLPRRVPRARAGAPSHRPEACRSAP